MEEEEVAFEANMGEGEVEVEVEEGEEEESLNTLKFTLITMPSNQVSLVYNFLNFNIFFLKKINIRILYLYA